MKGKPWIWLTAAALSLSFLLLAAGVLFDGAPQPLREAGETVSRPFLRLFSAAKGGVWQLGQYFDSVERLQAENARLREENRGLTRQARQGELAQGENRRLRALLELDSGEVSLHLLDAWVVARTPDSWRSSVTLDKGREQGVQLGQCVIQETGTLVGRVTELGETWAEVALVTDPAFSLAGQGSQSEALGSLEGRLDLMQRGELAFTYLGEAGQLGEGVLSFAQGDSYPAGLLIGTVTSLDPDPGGLTATAVVTPAADLENLGQVYLVTAAQEDRP